LPEIIKRPACIDEKSPRDFSAMQARAFLFGNIVNLTLTWITWSGRRANPQRLVRDAGSGSRIEIYLKLEPFGDEEC
jgi:hypothetical protein